MLVIHLWQTKEEMAQGNLKAEHAASCLRHDVKLMKTKEVVEG